MKTSYLVPYLSILSLAAAACDSSDDAGATPDAGPGERCDVRYADIDGDHKGDPSAWTTACAPGPGWVANSDDCDDTNPYVNADEAEICDGVDNDCRATTDEDEACADLGCRPVVNPATGVSYLFCAGSPERAAALTGDVCPDLGFRLAQIEGPAEHEYLVDQTRRIFAPSAKPVVWLGGGYTDGVWRWADGRQFWPDPHTGGAAPYASWLGGEPRQEPGAECLQLVATSEPGWRPVPCNHPTAVLCERDPDGDSGAPSGTVPTPGTGCDVRYADRDRDGAGDSLSWTTACAPGPGWVDSGGDCDDQDRRVHPGASETCDGVDSNCDGDPLETCDNGCLPRVDDATGKRYLFCTTGQDWVSARKLCSIEGFDLAVVGDPAENDFLVRTGSSIQSESWWFGASDEDSEGQWSRVDGTRFWEGGSTGTPVEGRYSQWAIAEPNNDGDEDCGELLADGTWNDYPCSVLRGFICER